MGLFDKKFCDICGQKIGVFGNRKLTDGNLCKDCAAKLSPFFSERRASSVAEIREQLSYREANREEVARFHATRSLGRNTKVLLDEDARRFVVTSARDLEQANPDVLDYSQVTGVELDINENKNELKVKNAQGQMVSYVPPRYEYSYDFNVVIRVNHQYFDTIRFRLNSSSVKTPRMVSPAIVGAMPQEYREYYEIGKEIEQTLTSARQEIRDEVRAAATPKQAVKCPHCGATSVPDANGCCEYCGGALF
ncbi:MAG: DUF4428 domain-containing protein [Firmicutes bacterium]|nr:DUF4428 domain-containing protein [Bacillota bacterium]